MNNRDAMAGMLKLLVELHDDGPDQAQMEMLGMFFDAVKQRNTTTLTLASEQNDRLTAQLEELTSIIDPAHRIAIDTTSNAKQQLAAIGLFGRDLRRSQTEAGILERLLAPQNSSEIQLAAVKALGRMGSTIAGQIMLQNWSSHSPSLRNAIADVLLGSENWSLQLLIAIKVGKVFPTDLDLPRRARLTKHSSPKVRELAAKVLAATESR